MTSLSERLERAQTSTPQVSPEGGIGLQSHSINELIKAKAAADKALRNVEKAPQTRF